MDHYIFKGGGVGNFAFLRIFFPLGCAKNFLAPYGYAGMFSHRFSVFIVKESKNNIKKT